MTTYSSNATPEQIAAFIKRQSSLVILTHAKPDGDALGSSLTVARAAAHAGVPSECWLLGPFPSWTDHFAGSTPVRKLSPDNLLLPASGPFADPSGVVVVDTGAWQQVQPLDAWLRPRADRAAVVDHHLHGNAEMAHLRLINSRAASCTEALAPVVDALLGTHDKPIPVDVAMPMYLGLATDTGWLRFSNTSADTLRLAARLVESGVDHPAIYQAVEQQQAITRPRLLGLALSSLEMFHDGRVAVMSVRDADLRALGAVGEDTGGFAEPVMSVSKVQVVVSLTEMPLQPDGLPLTKASLRSKPGPDAVDVAAVTHTLGGGGHARAAGVKLRQSLEAAKAAIVAALG